MKKSVVLILAFISIFSSCTCSSSDNSGLNSSSITTSQIVPLGGAKISGSIYYNDRPITEFTGSEVKIGLMKVEPWQSIQIQYDYSPQTGKFTISGVPPGEYTPTIFIESGYPYDVESGGDFTARVSGINPNIVISSNEDVISRDLSVVYHIHVTSPFDNQQRTRSVSDTKENIFKLQNSSKYTFGWEPVPEADNYRISILLKDATTNQTETILGETTKSTNFTVELNNTPGNQYYMFSVNAFNSNNVLVGLFQYYYTNGSGGWYNFVVIPD